MDLKNNLQILENVNGRKHKNKEETNKLEHDMNVKMQVLPNEKNLFERDYNELVNYH